MEKIRVLVVDDDAILGQIIVAALNEVGYETHYQTTLYGMKAIIPEFQPDIIVLDVEVGAQNGIDTMTDINILAPEARIMFISSHKEQDEMRRAIEAGAINYLTKPFEIETLLTYLKRYSNNFHPKNVQIGIFNLNLSDRLLKNDNQEIKRLTFFECKLLKLFSANINRIVSREQIEQELWKNENSNEHSLNNYIVKLRKILSVDPHLELITIPLVGYKLVDSKKNLSQP